MRDVNAISFAFGDQRTLPTPSGIVAIVRISPLEPIGMTCKVVSPFFSLRPEVNASHEPSGDQLNDYGLKTFDRIIILGVMHHLDDAQLTQLMMSLKGRLNSDGVLITFDVAFEDKQKFVASLLAKNDRGKFVRTKEQYLKFVEVAFNVEQADLRNDLLRVPYTHLLTRSTALD